MWRKNAFHAAILDGPKLCETTQPRTHRLLQKKKKTHIAVNTITIRKGDLPQQFINLLSSIVDSLPSTAHAIHVVNMSSTRNAESNTSSLLGGHDSLRPGEFCRDLFDPSDDTTRRSSGGISKFFQELESIAMDEDAEDSSHESIGSAISRIESRLLGKHIRSGRLRYTVSSVDVPLTNNGRNLLGGDTRQRRIVSSLSFASREQALSFTDRGDSANPRRNEVFSDRVASPSTRRLQVNGSDAASGHELLRRR